MARTQIYSKELILEKAVSFIKQYGIEKLSVRELAKYIGCSTQPIFRYYQTMEEFKQDLKQQLRLDYENFINPMIDKKNYLFTISYAYALYGKREPKIFHSLFLTDLAGTRTVKEVIETKRNRPTIEAMINQYQISLEQAETLYRDIRFYTHGIASQLCCGSIHLTDDQLYHFIEHMIQIYYEQQKEEKQ